MPAIYQKEFSLRRIKRINLSVVLAIIGLCVISEYAFPQDNLECDTITPFERLSVSYCFGFLENLASTGSEELAKSLNNDINFLKSYANKHSIYNEVLVEKGRKSLLDIWLKKPWPKDEILECIRISSCLQKEE